LTLLPMFLFGQTIFTSEELKSDSKLLWEALNELHPGLYRHTDTITMTKEFEKLLVEFSDAKSDVETFLSLSSFTSKIKCGHTFVNPFNQNNKIISNELKNQVLLPFSFSIIDKKIIVEEAFDERIKNYDVITHINDIKVELIIDSLTQYIKSDGDRILKKISDLQVGLNSKFEYFDYYLSMVFNFKNEVKLRTNYETEVVVQLMNKQERQKAYNEVGQNIKSNYYDDLWSYEFLDNYAYLSLGTFAIWKFKMDWEQYLDDFFLKLEQNKIQNLVIDIRGNEGGMDEVSDYLVNKLAKAEGITTFRKPHLAYKKLGKNIKPHVYTWSKWFDNTSIWTKKLNDDYRTIKFSSNGPKKIKKNPNAFQGTTYVLINESNSSATFILAEIIKENNYATLVGTETGGTKKGITGGQMFFLTLPNTKIIIDIPLIGRYPLTDLPDEGVAIGEGCRVDLRKQIEKPSYFFNLNVLQYGVIIILFSK